MAGTLYVTATPIGNLGDITYRAVETLRTVDAIACEDTRHTQKLLNHLGIKKKLVSYHMHNEEQRAAELIEMLEGGASVALVSDAGTPAISDPGQRLVRRALDRNIAVVSVPGPSAVAAAFSVSGLPSDSFFFAGFLPSKKSERRDRLTELKNVPSPIVFYEAPHRVARSLADCLEVLGDRDAVIARELTKLHEEIVRGRLSEHIAKFDSTVIKGEFVVLIDRGQPENLPKQEKTVAERVKELEAAGQDRRSALKQAAREFGLSRSDAYRELQAAKNS